MLSDWREDLGDASVLLPVGLEERAEVKPDPNLEVHVSVLVSPHQGVVLSDLPADEVMAGEGRVLKKDEWKGRKEGTGDNRGWLKLHPPE